MYSKFALQYHGLPDVALEPFMLKDGRWFIGYQVEGMIVKESMFYYKTCREAEAAMPNFVRDCGPLTEVEGARRTPNYVFEVIR